ncbi:hypothetical protein [Pantoea sp. S18]|uniref:hypothetical protein n=1 Tax=Pantoea sp. S18 TaxID=3019892 RepID=UPI002B1ED939|nr:hypothetical protein [Pantoea sp. S18]MEA5105624.1 hypothetical protein [Pantoea sp. S18]
MNRKAAFTGLIRTVFFKAHWQRGWQLTEGMAPMNDRNDDNTPDHINENYTWIKVDNSLKKWGTLILILIVLSGVAGVFSKGYLSKGYARDVSTRIEYERFGRVISNMDMKIIFAPSDQEISRVTLGGDFMDNFEVLTLHPQPFRAYSDGKKLILEYHLIKPIREQTLWLGVQPRTAGAGRTLVTVDGNKPISFFQLVYP